MSVKEYFLPQSLDEAINLLEEHGPSLLVTAGGTISIPLINEGISLPERVMGLRQAGLNYVRRSNGSFTIGATTRLTQMLKPEMPRLLQEAARNTGGWAIRNMGTVGGNLFAPPPAGDFAVAVGTGRTGETGEQERGASHPTFRFLHRFYDQRYALRRAIG